jgi:hypothetical protein
MKVGISVECTRCGRTKAPRGRSVADAVYNSMCTHDQCEGYYEEPKPGDLWPGETQEDFGYSVSSNATKEVQP